MASLILTFQDLYNKVSKYLGTYGSSGPSGTNLTDAKEVVNDAYRRFLDANPDWSFLNSSTKLTTVSGTATYELPDDFLNLNGIFQFAADSGYPEMEERSAEQITEYKSINDYSSYPEVYSISPTEYTKETGQRWEVTFYPTPDAAYTLSYGYKVLPKKLDTDDDIPLGAEYSDCLRQLCLAEAESNVEENSGVQEGKAAVALAAAVANDRKRKPHNLGYNSDGRAMSAWDIARGSYRISDVSFNT